jgi:hypothetical protein
MDRLIQESLTAIFIGLLVISGCAGQSDWSRTLNKEQQRVKAVSSSINQRVFDVSQDTLIKATINAFSNKNLSVITLEKDSGYMLSEGPQFLDGSTLSQLSKERDAQFRKELGGVQVGTYLIPKISKLRTTVNLYEKSKNKTLLKLKINPIQENCMLCEGGVCKDHKIEEQYCPLSPKMVTLWYQQLWGEIEKSIFMQRETILE